MPSHQDLVMTAAAIAARLGNGKEVQLGAGGWMTCCPAHDDNTPSLQISVDQNITFHCYAGCQDDAIREGVRAAGFQKIPEATRVKGGPKSIKVNKVAHEEHPSDEWFLGETMFQRVPDVLYIYRDTGDRPVFVVARTEADPPDVPKKLIRPVVSARAKGGTVDFWTCRGYPAPRILYNLPELARRLDAPVLVVEGEKTADAAGQLLPDYVVVTWSQGAQGVKQTGWGPLAGRDVTLWADNDQPGIDAMNAISLLIAKGKKAAKSIRVVLDEPDEGFPPGFDLADSYTDDLPPIPDMLGNATTLDTEALPDVDVPADDEEVANRVKTFLEKYAAVSMGVEHFYVDLPSRSPFRTDMIPYGRYSKHTLEQREAESYIELTPNRAARRRRYIDSFIESSKKIWLEGVEYDPSTVECILQRGKNRVLNLYCGFAYPPVPCDHTLWQCFVDHIYGSCETKEEADYILDWFAAKLQHPERMTGTMVILSGREGCGKTIVCDIVCKILGTHNAVKVPMSDLGGTFNSQYANKLLLNVEEYNPGPFKTQREMREKVKNLVTSQSILVNQKGTPAFENRAYHSVVATTNALTPEDISFNNRRMSFIHFDNSRLQMDGGRINDDSYFAPLVKLYETPAALSGLCAYMMTRDINMNKVMKPIATSMNKTAKTFIENPVCEFLRALADSGVLPRTEDVPNDNNSFPISEWPLKACAVPRSMLNKMFREHLGEFRSRGISETSVGMMLSKALNFYPKGIPETYGMHKHKTWKMTNPRGDIPDLRDRAFCLPDITELRTLVDKMAGEALEWSEFDLSDEKTDTVVVDFPGKKDDRF